jgi:hypothetical protein
VGRAHEGVYGAIGKIPAERRAAFAATMREQNPHTFSPGYLTQSEVDRVNRNLDLYVQRGTRELIVIRDVASEYSLLPLPL